MTKTSDNQRIANLRNALIEIAHDSPTDVIAFARQTLELDNSSPEPMTIEKVLNELDATRRCVVCCELSPAGLCNSCIDGEGE